MKHKILLSIHGYAGDEKQIHELLPFYEHHNLPIVVISPSDSPIDKVGPHICWHGAGLRGYTGQLSWDRQQEQMKHLLTYEVDWFFMNDADSFCLNPVLPEYLFWEQNTVWSNLVEDFRKPGEHWEANEYPWPTDYHKGYPLKAAQPPYFVSRRALSKIVAVGPGDACPITPFIDWQMVKLPIDAGVKLKPFLKCASCETTTYRGKAVMRECILKHGAEMIHSIKNIEAANECFSAYKERNGICPVDLGPRGEAK